MGSINTGCDRAACHIAFPGIFCKIDALATAIDKGIRRIVIPHDSRIGHHECTCCRDSGGNILPGFHAGPIERRHGPVIAILITGIVFGLAHYTHEEMTLALMPFYMLVAINYGVMAWLTNSVVPGIILHAGGNIFNAMLLLGSRRSEWRMTEEEKPLIWETGADSSFWISLIGFIIITAISTLAFRGVYFSQRTPREPLA
jgi:hypothetical protein